MLANLHEIPVAESLRNPDADLQVDALLDKLAFAAGADRVETLDAQLLAEDFLGDSIVSNIVAMGYAWQRGLVPVGLAAMQRAIELNGVAVEQQPEGVLARPTRRRRPGGVPRDAARAATRRRCTPTTSTSSSSAACGI